MKKRVLALVLALMVASAAVAATAASEVAGGAASNLAEGEIGATALGSGEAGAGDDATRTDSDGSEAAAEGGHGVAAATGVAPSDGVSIRGTIYLADSHGRAVVRLDGGEATVVAGGGDLLDLEGRPASGYIDGEAAEAAFGEPYGITKWRDGVLLSDRTNHALRYVDLENGSVYTAVGSGEAGYADGLGRAAEFSSPSGIVSDARGYVYIADTGNNAIRRMSPRGEVETLVGADAGLSDPTGICLAGGVLYIADSGNHRILAYKDGELTLVAGALLSGDAEFEGGYLNGEAAEAEFSWPQGIVVEDGVIYVADTGNGAVRAIKDGYVTTIADGLISPVGLVKNGGTLYVGDVFAETLVEVGFIADEASFSDLGEDEELADAVRFAVANGLMNGVGDGEFEPDEPMTRAMLLVVLARHAGFDPAGETWYSGAVAWAAASGVDDGGEPAEALTRASFDAILGRYAETLGLVYDEETVEGETEGETEGESGEAAVDEDAIVTRADAAKAFSEFFR